MTFNIKSSREIGQKLLKAETQDYEKLLEEWNGFQEVYVTILDNGFFFFWVPIDRKTYKDIMELSSHFDYIKIHTIEDMICKKCILYPSIDLGIFPAGIPSRITAEIMKASLFSGELQTS